jgi:hypothetical protein
MTMTAGDGSNRRMWTRQGISIQELEARIDALVELVESTDAISEGQAQTPLFLNTIAGVYPARPATTRPVIFIDPLVRPLPTGSVTGGGGMVPSLDLWLS